MTYDFDGFDLPNCADIKKAAENHFKKVGADPGEYQGFMAGCAFMCEHLGYEMIKMEDWEWVPGKDDYK